MTVFISHSFEDEARFDDLCLALEQQKIPFWNPGEMRGGSSLRDQLRTAIEKCDLCIFLATQKSVKSNWCGAELGAFWGAGKKVIVYLADDNLSDDELPQQFKGDIWYRRVRDVMREAKQTLDEAARARQVQHQVDTSSTRVGEISVGALLDLLRVTLQPISDKPAFSETMDRLAAVISARTTQGGMDVTPDLAASIQPYLMRLVGEPIESLKTYRTGTWKDGFSMDTTTGKWTGYSSRSDTYAAGDVEVHSGCLLVFLWQGAIKSCAVVTYVNEIGVEIPTKYNIGDLIAHVGETLPESMRSLDTFQVNDNPGILAGKVPVGG